MKFDLIAEQEVQRAAFINLKNGSARYKVNPDNISTNAYLVQEQAFVNTQNLYSFEFGSNAPLATAALGNIVLGDNNVFSWFALEILMGQGANANNRIYRSREITVDDGSFYNGELNVKFESLTPVAKMRTSQFKDEGDYIYGNGRVLQNIIRTFSGRVATVQVNIVLPNISALTLTANLFISVRLVGVLGQA